MGIYFRCWSKYCILPWIVRTHPCFGSKLSGKKPFILIFNSIIYLFIFRYLFLYYKRILAFTFEHIMVQEILCNKSLQNTRTDTRYLRYYPCMMCFHVFPSKIWAKKHTFYMTKYSTLKFIWKI